MFSVQFLKVISATMSVAGEYQKILTEDKGLGAGIHRGHIVTILSYEENQ